jgi:uncharacterized protein (DUF1800 family)
MTDLTTTIARNRFGLGWRAGETGTLSDPRGWLRGQLATGQAPPAALSGVSDSATTVRDFAQRRQVRRDADAALLQELAQSLRQTYVAAVGARTRVLLETDAPWRERLVLFWSNHFAVSADKLKVLGLAHTLENEVIRPGLDGRFADLLRAVTQHPAMLLYLDNERSMGDHSQRGRAAAARGRDVGLNENLAREVLELHSLGVQGGYQQADVTELAKALTGWSVAGLRPTADGAPGRFHFYAALHEPGARTVLGKRYAEGGASQAEAILADLARHPSTARHIATKLVRHMVADDPPAQAVARIAKVFQDSDGHLPTVHAALIGLDDAWAPTAAKIKTPYEHLVSALRLVGGPAPHGEAVATACRQMGQPVYMPGSPAGFPDTAARWMGSDSLFKRIEAADTIARRIGEALDPVAVSRAALGPFADERLRQELGRAESRAQGLALLLASPAFMRR